MDNSTVVKITVGSEVFQTTAGTVACSKVLSSSEKEPLVFADRDPMYFRWILQFLRGSRSFVSLLSSVERSLLLDEAKFYQVPLLVQCLEATHNVQQNKMKFMNGLIAIRFDAFVDDRRFDAWIKDDTWWTGLVESCMQFQGFRAIMESDAQTELLLTMMHDIVQKCVTCLRRSSSSCSDDDDDDDDDDYPEGPLGDDDDDPEGPLGDDDEVVEFVPRPSQGAPPLPPVAEEGELLLPPRSASAPGKKTGGNDAKKSTS